MHWRVKTFSELTNLELYHIMQLRLDVFSIEQECIYQDLDGIDTQPTVIHLFAEVEDRITCYLRILPPNLRYPNQSSLGRVVIHPDFRGRGLGHTMMANALEILDLHWPKQNCHISAQTYLCDFYSQHGFQVVGDEYLEDGLPHIGMER